MSGLSEEEINKMVTELVNNKKVSEETTTNVTEEKQDATTSNQDINKLMSGLFSELITTFIPPEVKNNKNLKMNKMMKLLLSSFEQSKNKNEQADNVVSEKEVQSDEDEPSEKEVQSDEEVEQSDEEDGSSDEEVQSDEEDGSYDEEVQSDEDGSSEEVQLNNEETNENTIFIILQNGNAIGYTTSFSTAEKKSILLYKQFIFENTTRYLRTEKSLGRITVYERNPHLLLPFLENSVFELSIVSLSEL